MTVGPCVHDTESIALTTDAGDGGLIADVRLSPREGNEAEIVSGTDQGLFVPGFEVVTALPPSPIDAQKCMLCPSDFSYAWPLVYSETIGKWVSMGGGAAAVNEVNTTGTITLNGASAWSDLSGSDVSGPRLVVPADGSYDIQAWANVTAGANGQTARLGLSINNADPTSNNRAGNGNANNVEIALFRRITGLNAGDAIALHYNGDGTTGSATFQRRRLRIVPVFLNP
jgi:hypothetical protein